MVTFKNFSIGAALVGAGLGLGAGAVYYNLQSAKRDVAPMQAVVGHTPAWYEVHRDVLNADDQKCAAQGSALPASFCQDVATADQFVSNQDAVNALNAASPASK